MSEGSITRAELLAALQAGSAEEAEIRRLRSEVDALTIEVRALRREAELLGYEVKGLAGRQEAIHSLLDRHRLTPRPPRNREPRPQSHKPRLEDRWPTPPDEGGR